MNNNMEENKVIINYLIALSDQMYRAQHKIEAEFQEYNIQIQKTRETLQLLCSSYQAVLFQQDACQKASCNDQQQCMDKDLQALQELSNDFTTNQQYGGNQSALVLEQKPNLSLLQQDAPLSLESFSLVDFPLDVNNNYAVLPSSCGQNPIIMATEQTASHCGSYQQASNGQTSDSPALNVPQQYVSNSPSSTELRLSQCSPIESLEVMDHHPQQSGMRITLPPLMTILEKRRKRRMQYDTATKLIDGMDGPAEDKRAKANNSLTTHHPLQNQDNPKSDAPSSSPSSSSSPPESSVKLPHESYNSNSSFITDLSPTMVKQKQPMASALLEVPHKQNSPNMLKHVLQFIKDWYGKEDFKKCFEDLQEMARTVCESYGSEPETESNELTWSRLSEQAKDELQERLRASALEKYPEFVSTTRRCQNNWFFVFIIQVFWSRRSVKVRREMASKSSAKSSNNDVRSPSASGYESDKDKRITRSAIKKEVIGFDYV
jgi:hypothetical protein